MTSHSTSASAAKRLPLVALGVAVCASATTPAAAPPPADGAARPRIGLVLSGGGARGAAHAGVLKVLEEMRIPISCIAGTSMGSIVGAGYASGTSVDEMQQMVGSIDSAVLFKENPPRFEQSIRRKQDDGINFVGPEVGFGKGGVALQKGVVSGVSLEAKLRQLSKAKGYYDFDKLPIPFRAVATDIATGEAVVLKSGELASAMRASMAVPGAVAPIEIDGRQLVDGMLTENLPVSVARDMCADVVIAVNVGTPLEKGVKISSLLSVTSQMIAILTEQNVQRSLKELGPQDVLITPDLEGFGTGDFDHLTQIIPRGEDAARKAIPQLARYSLPEDEYRAFRRHQAQIAEPDNRPVDEIRVAPLKRVNPETVLAKMETQPGQPLDPQVLDHDMQRIYGEGDFERVGYRIDDVDGKRVLKVQGDEKQWGPDYLRVGLTLFSDVEGDASFDLLASYRKTWINSLGAEWRNDLQLGKNARLRSEFYQPLVPSAFLFVAPVLEVQRAPADLFDDDVRIARFDIRSGRAEFDVGSQITRWGEIRAGVLTGFVSPRRDTGPRELVPEERHIQKAGAVVRVSVDQLDSLILPRQGVSFSGTFYSSEEGMGADDDYQRWDAKLLAATAFGDHAFHVELEGGGAAKDRLPLYEMFRLGGFLRLSGLRYDQLYGEELAFGRVVYMNQLQRGTLFQGLHLGLSLEAGQVRRPLVESNTDDVVHGGSLFFAADSPLGPMYLGYGRADGGNSSVYFFLGRPFQ